MGRRESSVVEAQTACQVRELPRDEALTALKGAWTESEDPGCDPGQSSASYDIHRCHLRTATSSP